MASVWKLMFQCCLVLVVSGSLVAAERGAVEDEEAEAARVRDLPGQPPVNFPHYSGYIKLDPLKGHKALFYWFFHAQQNSPHMPLVLWLNGGPHFLSLLSPLILSKVLLANSS